ncbi:ribosomal RNA processing protein 1 homolog B [Pseudophryne corroboree]|uniref:ribosomal RNA processing protein 1 homolog B n=1 Tax=Pseudophryne corroboree TaxID=495146 RepID=UPI00308214BE
MVRPHPPYTHIPTDHPSNGETPPPLHTPTDHPSNGGGTESGGHQAQDNEDIGPVLQFDYQALSDRLFALASKKNIPVRNRKSLYWLVKKFTDLAEGIFPQDDLPEEVSTDEDDDEFSSWRFHRRMKKAQEKLAINSGGEVTEPLKKGKRPRAALVSEYPPQLPGSADVPPAKKKCKKKRLASRQEDTAHPTLNGVAGPHNTEGEPEVPARWASTTPHKEDSVAPKSRVRRRRCCLLRLGLRVMPLHSALLRRRRLTRCRRKMISNKAESTLTPPAKVTSIVQDFVTFQKAEAPKPVYVKTAKGRGRQINCKSKKVTFSLNKNMTTEFKRTDRSLLVSPTGSSRVPFNPSQQPEHSVLKTPSTSPVPRARAADFF